MDVMHVLALLKKAHDSPLQTIKSLITLLLGFAAMACFSLSVKNYSAVLIGVVPFLILMLHVHARVYGNLALFLYPFLLGFSLKSLSLSLVAFSFVSILVIVGSLALQLLIKLFSSTIEEQSDILEEHTIKANLWEKRFRNLNYLTEQYKQDAQELADRLANMEERFHDYKSQAISTIQNLKEEHAAVFKRYQDLNERYQDQRQQLINSSSLLKENSLQPLSGNLIKELNLLKRKSHPKS